MSVIGAKLAGMDYEFTWYPRGAEPVTVPLRDITPCDLLDAAARCDMPHEWFTDTFLYRLLYGLTYQLLVGADAEVAVPDGATLEVRRVV